jgi:uncharacterized protein with HEPN domain
VTPEQIAEERALINGVDMNQIPWVARPTVRNYLAHWAHCVDVVEHLQQVQSSLPAAIAEQLKG